MSVGAIWKIFLASFPLVKVLLAITCSIWKRIAKENIQSLGLISSSQLQIAQFLLLYQKLTFQFRCLLPVNL